MDLQGKGVVVTGAGLGIGRAIAIRMATEGARVMVTDAAARLGMHTVLHTNPENTRKKLARLVPALEAAIKPACVAATVSGLVT